MYRRGNLEFNDIKEKIKLIEGSNTDYISENGNVYKKNLSTNLFFKKLNHLSKSTGYIYCGITMSDGKNYQRRVHKLVAQAFIEKIEGKDIVGHSDNDKTNNKVSNLYWTTISENTQKAFDDKLIVNAKGFDDSQSIAVDVFDINMNFIKTFGSQREAAKELGVSNSTIGRQCNGVNGVKEKPRCGYIFRFHK